METATIQALDTITDEGLFERVVTAVLRLDPQYAGLVHTGLTAAGKTQPGPLDGIGFGDDGHRMIVVEHTTTALGGLRAKWLNDPAAGGAASKPVGDLVKAIQAVKAERTRAPDLRATVVLATNRDPGSILVRDVHALARSANVQVELWSRGRIAHQLDLDPEGQFIRERLLGLEANRLSRSLWGALSELSLKAFSPQDDELARVPRALDRQIFEDSRTVLFIAAGSGLGKTVACYKALERQRNEGGLALVLPHTVVEDSLNLDQAVSLALRRLRPDLAIQGSPLAFVSERDPLLLLVEDVSRSTRPQAIVDKLASWLPKGERNREGPSWRLLCPVWPHLLVGGPNRRSDELEQQCLRPETVDLDEAAAMVVSHARQAGVHLGETEAETTAEALGRDPLLIGLNRDWTAPNPGLVVANFVEDSLQRAASLADVSATELRHAILALGEQMMVHRTLDPSWSKVLSWSPSQAHLTALNRVFGLGELIRLTGTARDAKLRFRHDRVRDWIFVEAASEMHEQGRLGDELAGDPLLADALGGLILKTGVSRPLVDLAARLNPLALFQALRLSNPARDDIGPITEAAQAWLSKTENQTRATLSLRWTAPIILQDLVAPGVLELLALLPQNWSSVMIGRMRNGDLGGGLALCTSHDLNSILSWMPGAVAEARRARGTVLTAQLAQIIAAWDVARPTGGLLRLAGLWGEPSLGPALQALWARDQGRKDRLDDYVWAMARCAIEDNAADLLDPVCAAWAALPSVRDSARSSPRDDLCAHEVRWAFEKRPPRGALKYFVDRAASPDLAWQIEYMLSAVDDPITVVFAAGRAAERRAKSTDMYFMNYLARERFQFIHDRKIEPLSAPSREALRAIWQDPTESEHRRVATFDLWCCGGARADLPILRQGSDSAVLQDRCLRQRLERGDLSAIPAYAAELRDPANFRSWFHARYVWGPELYSVLDDALARSTAGEREGELWELAQVIARLDRTEAEPLLLKYWPALGSTAKFVQLALFFGGAELLARAKDVIAASEYPAKLFDHLASTWGLKMYGEPGLTRESQLIDLGPYLEHIDDMDLRRFAEACDEHGWFALRRRLIDPRLREDVWFAASALPKSFTATLEHFPPHALTHDVQRALGHGAHWPEVRDALVAWLATRTDVKALEAAGSILAEHGQRADLSVLDAWAGPASSEAAMIREDTRFTLARRGP